MKRNTKADERTPYERLVQILRLWRELNALHVKPHTPLPPAAHRVMGLIRIESDAFKEATKEKT